MAAVGEFDDAGIGHHLDHPRRDFGGEDVAVLTVRYEGGDVDASDVLPEIPGAAQNREEVWIETDDQAAVLGPAQVVGDEGFRIAEGLRGVFVVGEGGGVGVPLGRG